MTNDDKTKNDDNYTHIEELDENLMDHDYDGIKELDNPAPAWIMAIFYVTIFFSVAYGAYYFWFSQGPTQEQEYLNEIAEHNEKYGSQKSEGPLAMVTDAKLIEEGKALYLKNCIACHGAEGQGGIGANFTDENWIHGCDFEAVFGVIKNGAPNGMIAYKAQMSDKKIQNIASYILSDLKGKKLEGKIPEGEVCK